MTKEICKNNLLALHDLNFDMYEKDFLLTWEKSLDEIKATLLVAECLKELHKQGRSLRMFDSGMGISIFRDKSTRTRFSYASAVNALGLDVTELDEEKSQVSHGETERETANMISFLTEIVGIRDDMYLGEGDKYQRNFSRAIDEGYNEGVLHQRPNIINLQSDIDHPTQTMTDLAKLKDYFGGLENLKGKKIAMTWAYSPSYGKPLSVPQGIIGLMSRMGMHVSLAYPEGYGLLPDVVDLAQKNAKEAGGTFEIVHSMEEAFEDADVVYPKSWAPFEVMGERTALLQKGDKAGLKALEKQCLVNNAHFITWECNEKMMQRTKNGNALYMHCLPADISDVSCVAGEVSEKVFDKYKRDTYHQASFKPFVIAAMICLARVKDPVASLENLFKQAKKRLLV